MIHDRVDRESDIIRADSKMKAKGRIWPDASSCYMSVARCRLEAARERWSAEILLWYHAKFL